MKISRKTNIAYVNQTSKISGAEQSLLSLLERLDRSFFNPFIVLPEEGPLGKKSHEMGLGTLIIPFMVKLGEPHRAKKSGDMLKAVYAMVRLIREKGIKIVHSNSLRTCYLSGLAARIAGVSSVAHIRDIHLSPFSNLIKSSLLNMLCDQFIAVSYATRDFILKQNPKLQPKIKVIYNGVNLEKVDNLKNGDVRSEFDIEPEAPVIADIGIINPVKGHDVVIKASASIRKKFPNLKVLIVGGLLTEKDKTYEIELRSLINSLDLDKNVILTGFRDDIYALINGADIVVLASRYQDPLPRILIEASALSRPIVATRMGGIPEIVQDGVSGLLVEPNNYQALANAIMFLLENKKRAREMSLAARKMAEQKFNIDRHVQEITKLYDELLS